MIQPAPAPPRWRKISLALTALFFIGAGAAHFIMPHRYIAIVPPRFPSPALLVIISGICEIAGGAGLLIGPIRQIAGWGLIALLIAVFPANIYMLLNPQALPGLHIAPWLLWLRLPLQGVLIVWVWLISKDQ